MEWILLIAGLAALFAGGEALVRGAVGIARRLSIPPLLIGLTVVGFGTSTPELLVSVDAALRGVPDIAIGNIIGSNIGNILLILGLAALVWPIRVMGDTLRRDTAVMTGAALVLLPAFWPGELTRMTGLALIAGLACFLLISFLRPGSDAPEGDDMPVPRLWLSLIQVGAGLAALMLGARWLVDGATAVARDLGLSEAFIGLSIVAIGTSLPELATSLIAALRRQSEIAIGNIVGSNIFNVLGILGITAVIRPIPVADRFLTLDLPVMIAVSALLTVLLMRPRIGRVTGLGLLAGYAAYVWVALA